MILRTVYVDATFTIDNLEDVTTLAPMKVRLEMEVPEYVLEETENGDDFRFEVALQHRAFPIFRAKPTLQSWQIVD